MVQLTNEAKSRLWAVAPGYTCIELIDYIEHGIHTGGFLYAVLTNDLRESIGRADDKNKLALPNIVKWLWNWAPAECWGSKEAVERWTSR